MERTCMKNFCSSLLILVSVAMPVHAQNTSFDSKEPVEITSDRLEVSQQENTAIFSGNVVAIQKDVRLKADRMIVHYQTGTTEKNIASPAPGTTSAPVKKQTIRKLEVEGHVFLSTPEETASGARGDYDVEGQLIHLYDDVVLTHGANTLTGNQLTYNFATGRSEITGSTVTATGESKGKQRVRALFVPEKKPTEPPASTK